MGASQGSFQTDSRQLCRCIEIWMWCCAQAHEWKCLFVLFILCVFCDKMVWPTLFQTGFMVGNVGTFPLAAALCRYGPLGGWRTIFFTLGTQNKNWVFQKKEFLNIFPTEATIMLQRTVNTWPFLFLQVVLGCFGRFFGYCACETIQPSIHVSASENRNTLYKAWDTTSILAM